MTRSPPSLRLKAAPSATSAPFEEYRRRESLHWKQWELLRSLSFSKKVRIGVVKNIDVVASMPTTLFFLIWSAFFVRMGGRLRRSVSLPQKELFGGGGGGCPSFLLNGHALTRCYHDMDRGPLNYLISPSISSPVTFSTQILRLIIPHV